MPPRRARQPNAIPRQAAIADVYDGPGPRFAPSDRDNEAVKTSIIRRRYREYRDQPAIMKRVPRLRQEDPTTGVVRQEGSPYQQWNVYREHAQRQGRSLKVDDFARFTAEHMGKFHFIRPKVTYKIHEGIKELGGCKYGSYSEGGRTFCLSNPNHHALSAAEHPIASKQHYVGRGARPRGVRRRPRGANPPPPAGNVARQLPPSTSSNIPPPPLTSAATQNVQRAKTKRKTQVERLREWSMKK